MNNIRNLFLIWVLLATSANLSAEVKISNAWIRLLPPAVNSTAAYFEIVSDQDDRLIGVEAAFADMSQLHESRMVEGVMQMRHLEYIDLPKNKTIVLEPSGKHVMLMHLKSPLKEGARYPLTLLLEKQGALRFDLPAKK